MATKKEALALAREHGATIDSNPNSGLASAWLPEGKEWQENGANVVMVNYGYPGDMPSVWDDLMELMRDGLR